MMYGQGMMDMSGWGGMHWLVFASVVLLVVYPVGLILKRLGYSPLWSIVVFVPVINIVGLWLIALSARTRTEG
jgi:hypothetical protein